MPYSKGDLPQPEVVWRFRLPSYPPKGPESTPVFDHEGNLYFGAHDGCFYSLDSSGALRWMFKTEDKIYSSPAIHEKRVVFCSGDGHCFCFDLAGRMQWLYNATDYFTGIKNPCARKLALMRTRWATRNAARQNTWKTRCWTSPNISSKGVVYITAYGLGLHALHIADGKPLWVYDLGQPRHHLSGVALNENEDIFVASQRNRLHSVAPDGLRRWTVRARSGYDAWGNPSINRENQRVFFTLSYRETDGLVMALDYSGNLQWMCDIRGGIRGSVAVMEGCILAAGLDGALRFIDMESGRIIRQVRLTSAERGLWTTPSIDRHGNILITTKDSRLTGSLCCLDNSGALIWRLEIGKALSIPVIDSQARVHVGSWRGEFLCLQT